MPVCPRCSRHIADDLSTCPFCHSSIQQNAKELKFRTENERGPMLMSVLAALLILGSFWLPWLRGTLVSGWSIALGSSGYGVLDLLDFPDLHPDLLSLFWLVPFSSLLLLSVGWGRLFGSRMYWRPLWTLLVSSISLALLVIIFIEKIRTTQPYLGFWPAVARFPSQVLVGFWLTLAGFLIALPSLFLPYMRQKTSQTQRPVPTQTQIPRRTLLSHGLNLTGLLGVGSVGVILGQIWREDWLRAHAYRLALPSETLVSNYYLPFLAWSPDSAYLAETRDGNLKSWNVATGQKVITYPLPLRFDIANSKSNPCRDIAWSPDGQYLVSWLDSEDKNASLGVWNAQTGTFFQAIPETSGWSSINPSGVSWSPDSKRLAIGRIQGVQIWDITSAGMVGSYTLSKGCASVKWSPDGRSLAAAEILSNIVHIWDIQSGQHIQTTIPYRTAIHDLAWAPDSKRLALALLSAYADSGIPAVLLWDVRTNQQAALQGLWHSGTCVSWSPDGTRLAAGGDDQIVQVWNVNTGARIFTYQGHTKAIYWLAWSPDGKLLASAGRDNHILIWDAPTL